MPQNMQKRQKVAQLDLDDELELTANEEKYQRLTEEAIEKLAEDDPRYLAALKLWQHGHTAEKIAKKLVRDGVLEYRTEAMLLAQRVMKENPEEQVTNARILLGAAGFISVVALLFIIPNMIEAGLDGLLQPSTLLLLVAAWFAFKGFRTWQSAKR